jgi:rhodanese-related sulfurtransferase
MPVKNIAPAALSAWLKDAARVRPVLLDVREPWEYQTARLEDSKHIPLREIAARCGELEAGADVVVICHHGGRSMQAAMFLDKQGFASVHNLAGGVDAWARQIDPAMPVY